MIRIGRSWWWLVAIGAVFVAVIGGASAIVVAGPIVRDPSFHAYADQRTLLGIPHTGDVLSNFPFIFIGLWGLHRGAPAVGLGVIAIGIGSTIYHWAPSDTTLLLDWAAIAITLMLLLAAVMRDRVGPRAGHVVLAFGPLVAVGAIASWLFTGGTTSGGNMAPYVAVQLLGIALPPLLAVTFPGRIRASWLLAALAAFALARVFATHDAELLAALGVSGHSWKHLAAAGAATLALRGLTPPIVAADR